MSKFVEIAVRIAAAAALGYVSWQHAALMPLLLLFPLVVQHNASPRFAYLYALAYYLAISHEEPGAYARYHDSGLAVAVALWLAHEALLASAWALGSWVATHAKRSWRLPVAFVLGSLLAVVPPLGWLGYGHPLFVAGYILPGLGLAGIALAAVLMLAIAWLWQAHPRYALLSIAPLGVLAVLLQWLGPAASNEVRVFTTYDGVYRHSEGFERTQAILGRARELLDSDSALGLLPEGYAGIWGEAFQASMSIVEPDLARRHKTLLVGTMVPAGKEGRVLDNVLYAFGEQSGAAYVARIPVPSALMPWVDTRDRAHPGASATGVLNGQRVLYALCWETYLLEHLGRALLPGNKVIAIVAASNLWMLPTLGTAYRVQRQSLQSIANLGGVAVYWSVNFDQPARTPTPSGHALRPVSGV